MQNTSRLTITLLVVSLLAACVTDVNEANDLDRDSNFEFHTASIQGNTGAADVAGDALRLYEELAARLQSRGYTTTDAWEAYQAGDEARAHELFGYAADEYEAIGARWTAIAEALDRYGFPSFEDPEGITCDWSRGLECAWSLGLSSLGLRGLGVGWPGVAAAIAGSVGLCAYNNCRWERSGSGPGTQPRKK